MPGPVDTNFHLVEYFIVFLFLPSLQLLMKLWEIIGYSTKVLEKCSRSSAERHSNHKLATLLLYFYGIRYIKNVTALEVNKGMSLHIQIKIKLMQCTHLSLNMSLNKVNFWIPISYF